MAKPEIPSTEFSTELARGNLKTAMAEAGAKNPHALWMVPYGQIKIIPGFNTRIRTPEYEAHIEATKESIKENGFYQDKPLTGYVALEDGQQVIYLTDGHTRHEAAGRAIDEGYSLENLPIVIKPNGTSMEDLTIALVTSNNGRALTPYETAVVVKRLLGMGLDEATIAKRLNFKTGKRYVDDLLSLIGAPKAVRDLVIAGKVSSSMAIDELKANGTKAVETLKAAVETAQASGKAKASPKHLSKSKKPATARKPAFPKEIDAKDVLADAEAAGFAVGTEVDDKLVTFAATLLDRVGVTVFKQEADPASDL
jgi:ParB family chromosome partitioning protein